MKLTAASLGIVDDKAGGCERQALKLTVKYKAKTIRRFMLLVKGCKVNHPFLIWDEKVFTHSSVLKRFGRPLDRETIGKIESPPWHPLCKLPSINEAPNQFLLSLIIHGFNQQLFRPG